MHVILVTVISLYIFTTTKGVVLILLVNLDY